MKQLVIQVLSHVRIIDKIIKITDQNKSLDFLLNPFRFMYVSLYNCMFVTIYVSLNEINML